MERESSYMPVTEAEQTNSEQHEKEKKLDGNALWGRLAGAFGGYSQVPDKVVGMALAGQINNGELSYSSTEECSEVLDGVVNAICEQWKDLDEAPRPEEVRGQVIAGMKEATQNWTEGEDNKAVGFIRTLEGGEA